MCRTHTCFPFAFPAGGVQPGESPLAGKQRRRYLHKRLRTWRKTALSFVRLRHQVRKETVVPADLADQDGCAVSARVHVPAENNSDLASGTRGKLQTGRRCPRAHFTRRRYQRRIRLGRQVQYLEIGSAPAADRDRVIDRTTEQSDKSTGHRTRVTLTIRLPYTVARPAIVDAVVRRHLRSSRGRINTTTERGSTT